MVMSAEEKREKLDQIVREDAQKEEARRAKAEEKAVVQLPKGEDEALKVRPETVERIRVKPGREIGFLDEMLRTHWVLMIGGKVRVARWIKSELGGEELQLFGKDDFKTFYANKFV